ncbi:hypothetical protein PHYBOEH_009828 [Phytophthora boehmeriae]|uniref:Peptidase C1A papain C-terminal domain-containing protein n=1 Tax=Phytophthora boehmeriae TaxID=109152 RepID=A0A8T1X640_9STRA|nr:hypothetical protein PHYBOEH_009828 [Phytophthora boehmeriae]
MQAVEEFELRLYHAQTRTQRRLGLGPTRTSDEVRAEALANTERVVTNLNEQHQVGNKTYFAGWNELSDLTDDEYRAFLGSRPDKDSPRKKMTKKHKRNKRGKAVSISFTTVDDSSGDSEDSEDAIVVPAELDWTTVEGGKYMTPIKNQGTCGSCWAFAGVSVVESRFAIENDVQASPLSVEQVLSCSAPLDHIRSKYSDNMTSSSQGCSGGMPFLTYAYLNLAKPHGLSCATSYPYVMATGNDETECAPLADDDLALVWTKSVSDYKVVESSDEQALLRAVTRGPVTSNIDATGDGFRHYAGGIYDAQDCLDDGEEVNHAVVVVGFGQEATGEKFWIIRNTWGTMWGENGYMRIARGNSVSDNGPCNLYLYSSYPVNLTAATNFTSGEPTCSVQSSTFEPLALTQLLGLSGNQIILLVLSSVLSLLAGVLLYHGWEFAQNRKEAAGHLTYQDSYARWVLPTRDQIATALAQRRRPRQQQRTEGDRQRPRRQQRTGAGQ